MSRTAEKRKHSRGLEDWKTFAFIVMLMLCKCYSSNADSRAYAYADANVDADAYAHAVKVERVAAVRTRPVVCRKGTEG